METYIISTLEEQRRDALVAYYLGQVVPSSATSAPLGITTPDDLYEYLLIDNQVSGEVETSRVAQGIASVQQYINAIYNGMEPGYAQGFDEERLQEWRERMSEYSVWTGYQMIEDYPENYIDPTLRLGKTSQFEEFESELEQSRISEDAVQMALKTYLDNFELVSNLRVVACYVNGENFKQADYYFFGRQNVEPFAYYWRKAEINLQENSTQVIPSSWTEWKNIDVAFDATVTHVRPVVIDGRLHIIWVELGQAEVEDGGGETGRHYYRAKMSYKKISNMWSPATLIYEGLTEKQDLGDQYNAQGVLTGRFTLVASMDIRFGGEPRLIVCFQFRAVEGQQVIVAESERFLLVFDKLFNKLTLPEVEKAEMYGIAAAMLGGDPSRVQYPLKGSYEDSKNKWIVDSVAWNVEGDNDRPAGGLNSSLELNAELNQAQSGCSLDVRGVCTAERYKRVDFKFFMAVMKELDFYEYHIAVRGENGSFHLEILVYGEYTDSPKPSISGELKFGDAPVGSFTSASFETLSYGGNYVAAYKAVIRLNIEVEDFPSLTPAEAQAGAGFLLKMAGEEFSLVNDFNYYSETVVPLTHNFGIWSADPLAPYSLTLNGAAKTPWQTIAWVDTSTVMTLRFGALENSGLGYNSFDIIRMPKPEAVPVIVSTPEGGQFLDLAALGLAGLRYVRLNTTFAKELVNRVEFSVKNVLSWETQHTEEPPVPLPANSPNPPPLPLDFKGANGRYFWELFFHVPHLVAHRLHAEFDYLGAENWLHYLFNPLERSAPLFPAPLTTDYPYWVSRPLTFDYDPAYEWGGLGDPDAIAYGEPSHYRKAIFVFYLNNLIARGDMLYRQLTRDTLNQAQLFYIRAASLLGPLSKGRSISRWTPMSLENAAASDYALFANFEASGLKWLEHDIPSRTEGKPWLRLLDASWFRVPVNEPLLDLWDRLALRLYNLRHNLTLDGNAMSLPLYAPAANPYDLLKAQAAGGGSGLRRLGSLAIIAPYRFRTMLPRVQNAVDTLIRYGDQLRGYMELRDRADQEERQQSDAMDLSAFTESLQSQMQQQAKDAKAALEGSKAAVLARKVYYERLVEEDVSRVEMKAQDKQLTAKQWNVGTAAGTSSGNLMDTLPNIYGASNGGFRLAGVLFAATSVVQIRADGYSLDSERSVVSDQYRRRRLEWNFLARQAEQELAAIDLQITAQGSAIEAANTSLAQTIKARQQARDYYTFLKSRETGPALYKWLFSQMFTLYFQAYDAVLSMCLSTEACWQYEIGDRDTRFISTSAWADNRFGLTAGETLKLGLLQMESAFLSRHERRLELTKTISLKNLLKNHDANAYSEGTEPLATGWEAVIAQLRSNGEITFDLKASLFDKDYPGHYLRQLVSVSVSIPAVVGPYEDTRVMLTQQSSSTLLKPDLAGVRHLYKEANELPQDQEDENIAPTHIVFNPRAQQQIGISTGVDDHGMFMLDFGDERYFPFEGTGAVSRWNLSFPRHASERQRAILDSLTDIILHVRYLAVDGGKVFASEVETLVAAVEEGEVTRRFTLPGA